MKGHATMRKPMPWMMIVMLVAAVALALPAVWTSSTVAAAQEEEDGEMTLKDHMDVMDRSLRLLRRTLRDASRNEESLKTVSLLQQATLMSKDMTPAMTEKLPEGDRAAFVADYRRDMAKLLIQTVELEIALLDGNNAKAQELYDAIKATEDPGHEKFMEQGDQ